MPPDLAQPWRGFLADLDGLVSHPVHLHCCGGFVVTTRYGCPEPPPILDVLSILPGEDQRNLTAAGRGSGLHKAHGVYLDVVTVATYPDSYEERLTEMHPGLFRHIRLLALDPYDLVLTKLTRNADRDRGDVEFLATAVPLDTSILRQRYRDEMRAYMGIAAREDLTLDLWIEIIEERREFTAELCLSVPLSSYLSVLSAFERDESGLNVDGSRVLAIRLPPPPDFARPSGELRLGKPVSSRSLTRSLSRRSSEGAKGPAHNSTQTLRPGSLIATELGMSDSKRFVYVLESKVTPERHYVGLSSNVSTRLTLHNNGPSMHSSAHRPWRSLVSIEFAVEGKAIAFERYLKSGSGRAFARRHFSIKPADVS